MIEKMHEKSQGPVFKIIFALISISFVLGGIGTGLMSHDTSAVKINGTEISQQAFNNAKNHEQNRRFTQEGQAFSDKLDDPAYVQQFNQDVFTSLINDELLRQYAKELHLDITSEQVKSQIVNTPTFHQNGKFDNALYQQTLRNNGLSPDHYAAIVKEGMLMSQLQEGIIGTDFSVPAQQELLAKLLLQKRQVRFANYPVSTEAEKINITDAEAQAFYEANKNRFTTPEKMKVEYVLFSLADMEKNITVTDEQISTYYETNKANYATVGETQLAHIQVATENEANTIIDTLSKGGDFAQLAKEKSQDLGSAAQGGDLGWAKAGTFPKAFEDAANNLQAGQTSQVVKIDNAFHIIKVLDRKVGNTLPLEQVKEQIKNIIRTELAQQEYSRIAREMAKKAYEETKSLNEIAQMGGVSIQTTDEFSLPQLPEVLSDEKITKVLFGGDLRKNGLVSEAIELGNNTQQRTMFLRVSQYQPESLQTFDTAKEEVILATKTAKAIESLKVKLENEIQTLNAGGNISATFKEPVEMIFAQAQIEQPQIAQTIFAMPKPTDKPSYQIAQEQNGDMLIIALDKITEGDSKQFENVSAQFAAADQAILFDTLLKDLRSRAKIEINQEFVDSQTQHNQ